MDQTEPTDLATRPIQSWHRPLGRQMSHRLRGRCKVLVAASTFKYTTVFTLVAALYLVMSIPLILLVGWLERRTQGERR